MALLLLASACRLAVHSRIFQTAFFRSPRSLACFETEPFLPVVVILTIDVHFPPLHTLALVVPPHLAVKLDVGSNHTVLTVTSLPLYLVS